MGIWLLSLASLEFMAGLHSHSIQRLDVARSEYRIAQQRRWYGVRHCVVCPRWLEQTVCSDSAV
jgi:hypothetical protein